jgi:hypothetical protein
MCGSFDPFTFRINRRRSAKHWLALLFALQPTPLSACRPALAGVISPHELFSIKGNFLTWLRGMCCGDVPEFGRKHSPIVGPGSNRRSGSSSGCSALRRYAIAGRVKSFHRLLVAWALANLLIARRHLLALSPGIMCPQSGPQTLQTCNTASTRPNHLVSPPVSKLSCPDPSSRLLNQTFPRYRLNRLSQSL